MQRGWFLTHPYLSLLWPCLGLIILQQSFTTMSCTSSCVAYVFACSKPCIFVFHATLMFLDTPLLIICGIFAVICSSFARLTAATLDCMWYWAPSLTPYDIDAQFWLCPCLISCISVLSLEHGSPCLLPTVGFTADFQLG
jgi:hypothetical protein